MEAGSRTGHVDAAVGVFIPRREHRRRIGVAPPAPETIKAQVLEAQGEFICIERPIIVLIEACKELEVACEERKLCPHESSRKRDD